MFKSYTKHHESGNVLFLILIAVALFAALSYAVTQSTRSGSGSTEREGAALNSATITQHPTALRTAVVRMVLGGLAAEEVGFETPSATDFNDGSSSQRAFHPLGGAAVYQTAPDDAVVSGFNGRWYINYNFEVPEIGQDGATAGTSANELIAFLPGVSSGICSRINEEFMGSTTIPALNATNASIQDDHEVGETIPADEDLDPGSNEFDGQPTGCFEDSDLNGGSSAYIVFSVILER